MNHPNTQQIEDAFRNAAVIAADAEGLKQNLIRLHILSKAVDDANFLVENHHRWADPADDKNDVLFARLVKAQKDLSDAYAGGLLADIHNQTASIQSLIGVLAQQTR